MLATHSADWAWTGRAETSACQNESAGVNGQAGAPGTGLPSAPAAVSATTRTSSVRTGDVRTGRSLNRTASGVHGQKGAGSRHVDTLAPVSAHRLTNEQARRIAIRAQLLDAERPTDLLEVVGRLMFLQVDPTAAIAPNADLVAYTRLGGSYELEHLTEALEQDRSLYEVRAFVRPTADLPLFLASMSAWPFAKEDKASPPPGPVAHTWLEQNDAFRKDVLGRLRESGPLQSRDIPDTSAVPWQSTGWTGNRNVTQMLEFLNSRGEVAIAGRVGRQRLWDLPERVYPRVKAVPLSKARTILASRRVRSLGIARPKVVGVSGERYWEDVHGEPAEVEGATGEWVVDPEALERDFEGRTALLSPFDRLVHDRVRAQELFDFEYTLEMYKPADKRRWGYFALPILHEDRLVGKLDATADRKAAVLRVHAIHEDVRFTRDDEGVGAEIDELATWLGLERELTRRLRQLRVAMARNGDRSLLDRGHVVETAFVDPTGALVEARALALPATTASQAFA